MIEIVHIEKEDKDEFKHFNINVTTDELDADIVTLWADKDHYREYYANEWMNAYSDPPKKDGKYLVTIRAFDRKYVDIASYALKLSSIDKFDFRHDNRPGWYDYSGEWGYYEVDDVIAWMPLVEEYKG